ncbi:GNAT family N-acetyltransferase [Paenibacillus sp. OAS669]|uniref:GNAT family N-acetyltransferase n=1 Tax=Paenibacillus sp. OAS669 TaxID=2663821 RepID=UPI00178BD52D|nr:GNAT family N-acetyltransferase [Paenibacillus sp. OAS669]MBE1445180.1 ribosomal protein S18 acetylase RimI-like enzyme [Paenibacillus sp. OAS669]
MSNQIKIETLSTVEEHVDELSKLLVDVVDGGASIGFLPPMAYEEAQKYWRNVTDPNVILFAALWDRKLAGTVQLQLCPKQNGLHRAEMAKLMTHPDYRNKGIGRLLMQTAERRALEEGITLLVLDTREGDPSNHLYASLGYIQAGRIPDYAKSADGKLDATVIYYKQIS